MVNIKKLLPILSGTCVLLYIYGWTEGIEYPAYVPLVWCAACFINDFYNYLEHKHGRST